MKSRDNTRVSRSAHSALARLVAVLAITCAFFSQALAQTSTPADTPISNTATATYSDGGGGSYDTSSNTVTVTVAKVSGLRIIPDVTGGTSNPSVVPGQSNVSFMFTVTNTSNFTDDVLFLANGASISVASGMATVASAYIDINGNNAYDNGVDVNINDGVADSVSFTKDQSLNVFVLVNVNSAAPAGSIINVRLGDADDNAGNNYDNEAADATTANEVRTSSNASVNGRREARGDRSATVELDAQLSLSLTAPAGPVALGSNITYVWQLCNTGARDAASVTLTNAPAGSQTGVFIFAPVPTGTTLLQPQALPAGTLYSSSPVTDNPVTTAVWQATPPANTTRVAFNVGNTLSSTAGSNCSANINMVVTITTTDATNAITNQGNAYANNSVSAQISTLSPLRTTLLEMLGDVLNGPVNAPGATNTTNNDDFTNKSVTTGIANVPPCPPVGPVTPACSTTAQGVVTFTNTVQNTGNANDTYTLTVPTFPAGATVIVTVGGVPTTVVLNGNPTGNAVSPLAVAFNDTEDYTVQVTLPAGKAVLNGYDTVIRATSGNTNTEWNETIDRVYTGFIELSKTVAIENNTGVGNGPSDAGADDAVPGAHIIYAITYRNVSSAQAAGGNGNVQLTASNIVISEVGDGGTNNWRNTTTQVVGPPVGLDPSDTNGGTIIDGVTLGAVTGATYHLRDTVASLAPQQSGTFTFRRRIN